MKLETKEITAEIIDLKCKCGGDMRMSGLCAGHFNGYQYKCKVCKEPVFSYAKYPFIDYNGERYEKK